MSHRTEIEQAIRSYLPTLSKDDIDEIATTIAGYFNSDTTSNNTKLNATLPEDKLNIVHELAGKTITTSQSQITFGEGSQIGDVKVNDVVSGHSFRIVFQLKGVTLSKDTTNNNNPQIASHGINIENTNGGMRNVSIGNNTTSFITNTFKRQPLLLYLVILLSLFGLFVIIRESIGNGVPQSVSTSTTSIALSVTPPQSQPATNALNSRLKDQIVGTWQDTTKFLDIDPESAFYAFYEDGTVVLPGASGQYIILEDQKKIQINLSSGGISRVFAADISIEGDTMRWNINNPREFLRIPQPTSAPAGIVAPTETPIVLEVILKRMK